jgi:hypothetical protein
VVWGSVLITTGALWLLSLAGVVIVWSLLLPIALIAIGVLVLAFGRRPIADALVGLGIAVAIVALLVPGAPQPSIVSAGDRVYTPDTLADLESSYDLGAGTATLDLRALELTAHTTEVAVNVGFGELIVIVPEDVELTGRARVAFGEVEVDGRTQAGVGPSLPLGGAAVGDGPTLDLELQVAFGRIEVTRPEVAR